MIKVTLIDIHYTEIDGVNPIYLSVLPENDSYLTLRGLDTYIVRAKQHYYSLDTKEEEISLVVESIGEFMFRIKTESTFFLKELEEAREEIKQLKIQLEGNNKCLESTQK